jgi:hypothetical protein
MGTLTFSRIEATNAPSLAFAREITEAVRELDAMEDVRVIVLTSSGRISEPAEDAVKKIGIRMRTIMGNIQS